MMYLGGKSRIAGKLARVILDRTDNRSSYWEPFVGGGAMAARMGQHFDVAYYSDSHADIVALWDAVLNAGWTPPTTVTYEEYQKLRHAEVSPLRGFVGFGTSFGGKWFGGYARGDTATGLPRNYADESARALMKGAETMKAKVMTYVFCADALTLTPGPWAVVYCDPPYAGTTAYAKGNQLDHDEFWRTAERWSALGAKVFVSEYSAPSGWECVWEQPLRSNVRHGASERHIATERLFTLRDEQL